MPPQAKRGVEELQRQINSLDELHRGSVCPVEIVCGAKATVQAWHDAHVAEGISIWAGLRSCQQALRLLPEGKPLLGLGEQPGQRILHTSVGGLR